MIKKFVVRELNKKIDLDLVFYEDINLLTGKNGSGKTTVLKLIWYLISGNIERIIPELSFQYVELETDKFYISITVQNEVKGQQSALIKWSVGQEQTKEKTIPVKSWQRNERIEEINNRIASLGSSIFFPTFRRIEGGFSISSSPIRQNRIIWEHYDSSHIFSFQQAISDISRELTVKQHQFIASISTTDIIELLTTKYADISEKTNKLHINLSESISKMIRDYNFIEEKAKDNESLKEAELTLKKIQTEVAKIANKRESLLKPFSVLSGLINDIFQYKGIQVTDAITLGETKEAILSAKLSAGEKQMLSFLCYNAFEDNSPIFIDEPEISLHVDWQRILFPTLLEQSTNNQFIIATHSPFIYSKYPDKELILSKDKGDS